MTTPIVIQTKPRIPTNRDKAEAAIHDRASKPRDEQKTVNKKMFVDTVARKAAANEKKRRLSDYQDALLSYIPAANDADQAELTANNPIYASLFNLFHTVVSAHSFDPENGTKELGAAINKMAETDETLTLSGGLYNKMVQVVHRGKAKSRCSVYANCLERVTRYAVYSGNILAHVDPVHPTAYPAHNGRPSNGRYLSLEHPTAYGAFVAWFKDRGGLDAVASSAMDDSWKSIGQLEAEKEAKKQEAEKKKQETERTLADQRDLTQQNLTATPIITLDGKVIAAAHPYFSHVLPTDIGLGDYDCVCVGKLEIGVDGKVHTFSLSRVLTDAPSLLNQSLDLIHNKELDNLSFGSNSSRKAVSVLLAGSGGDKPIAADDHRDLSSVSSAAE